MSHGSKFIQHRKPTLEEIMTNVAICTKTYLCCEHARKFSGMIENQTTNLSKQKMSFLSLGQFLGGNRECGSRVSGRKNLNFKHEHFISK